MGAIEDRLSEIGVTLPGPMPTAGAYSPVVIDGGLAWTSGMLGVADMALVNPGCLGVDLDVEAGRVSARAACVTALGALHDALGSLDRIERVLRLTGYIRSSPDFGQLPMVLDGASELIGEVFGPAGRHSRAAIGVSALPFGGSVEVELTVRLKA